MAIRLNIKQPRGTTRRRRVTDGYPGMFLRPTAGRIDRVSSVIGRISNCFCWGRTYQISAKSGRTISIAANPASVRMASRYST